MKQSTVDPDLYRAFLIRMWRGEAGEVWRVSLEDTGTRQRYLFPDLDAAFGFLRQQGRR